MKTETYNPELLTWRSSSEQKIYPNIEDGGNNRYTTTLKFRYMSGNTIRSILTPELGSSSHISPTTRPTICLLCLFLQFRSVENLHVLGHPTISHSPKTCIPVSHPTVHIGFRTFNMKMKIIPKQLNLRNCVKSAIRSIKMTRKQNYRQHHFKNGIPKVIYPISPFALFLAFETSGIPRISRGGSRLENNT